MHALFPLRKAVLAAAGERVHAKTDPQHVQDLVALLLAAASPGACGDTCGQVQWLHQLVSEAVMTHLPCKHMTVLSQALFTFLLHCPQYTGTLLRALMTRLQHGPTQHISASHTSGGSTQAAAQRAGVSYSKKQPPVCQLLAVFKGCVSPTPDSPSPVCLDRFRHLAVTLLAEVVRLYQDQQTTATAKHLDVTPPVYIQPSPLVRLFVDCLLQLPCQSDRRLLLAAAMQLTESHRNTVAHGNGHTGDSDGGGKRRKASDGHTVVCQPESESSGRPSAGTTMGQAWSWLMAHACHDETLRYTSTILSQDLVLLLVTHPSLLSDTLVTPASQVVVRILTGMNTLELELWVRSALLAHPRHQNTAVPLVRLLHALSQPRTLQAAFPSSQTAAVSITSPAPTLAPLPVEVGGADRADQYVGAEATTDSDSDSGSGEGAGPGEDSAQVAPPGTGDETRVAAVSGSGVGAGHPAQQQHGQGKPVHTPSGVQTAGSQPVKLAIAPLQPAWVFSQVVAILLRLACHSDSTGDRATSAPAQGALREILATNTHLILPTQPATATTQAARAITTWAKTAPAAQVALLVSVWSQVLGLPPQLLHIIQAADSTAEAVATTLMVAPPPATLVTAVPSLLCLCNYTPPQSPLYALGLSASLGLVSRQQDSATPPDTRVHWVTGAILGTPTAAPSLSYVECCRADLMRACLLAAGAAPVQAPTQTVAAAVVAALTSHVTAVLGHNSAVQPGLSASGRRVIEKVLQSGVGQQSTDTCFSAALIQAAAQVARSVTLH